MLQKAGVPAAAVVNLTEQITYDPQVKDRDVYQWITYHDGVKDPIFRVPWILSKTPTQLNRSSPYTGQHNNYLLSEVLEISDEEIADFAEEGVIGVSTP